jgi:surfactin synthase thioesterase subunit
MRQWRHCTIDRFKVEPVNGDHYFVTSMYKQVHLGNQRTDTI